MDDQLAERIEKLLSSSQEEIEALSPQSRELLYTIASSLNDSEDYLRMVRSIDYEESPPDFHTFITDPKYMGGEDALSGGSVIYPYWKNAHSTIADSLSRLVVFTGPIGGGKSFNARIHLAYDLCHVLCLRDAYKYFNLARTDPIAVLFFNLTQSLSDSGTFRAFQNLIQASPWFMSKGVMNKGTKNRNLYFPEKRIELIVGTPNMEGFGFVGKNVISGLMDEISEIRNAKSMEAKTLLQQKGYDMFTSAYRRMESRFKLVEGVKPPGRLFLVSSKQSDSAFLEQFVEENKSSKDVIIFDDPIWAMKPPGQYSTTTFPVAVGDKFRESKVLTEEEVPTYEADGYSIVRPPIDVKESFIKDVDGSLREIAGVSVTSSRTSKLIPNRSYILECANVSYANPFTHKIIYMGLKEDKVDLSDYFILPPKITPTERFIHVDLAKSGDAAGFAMSHISGTTKVERYSTEDDAMRELEDHIVTVDCAIQIRNFEHDVIPFYKIRQFVNFLRSKGYNIRMVTFDGWQSEDSCQLLTKAGFNSEVFSLDRTDVPYMMLRSSIYEKRVVFPYYETLLAELSGLEHDRVKRKVDHPVGGQKDVADAVCGSVAKALMLSQDLSPERTMEALSSLKKEERISDIKKKFWFVEEGHFDKDKR